mgnify:CR=1 FL=1
MNYLFGVTNMKIIFTILLINFALMQELQVDGNLTVTGNISSAIIDSLQSEINNLQNQLNEYSGGVKTRIIDVEVSFSLDRNEMNMFVPLNGEIGISNNWYSIIPVYVNVDNNCGESIMIDPGYNYPDDGINLNERSYGYFFYFSDNHLNLQSILPITIQDSSPTLRLVGDLNSIDCSGTITLLITSEN